MSACDQESWGTTTVGAEIITLSCCGLFDVQGDDYRWPKGRWERDEGCEWTSKGGAKKRFRYLEGAGCELFFPLEVKIKQRGWGFSSMRVLVMVCGHATSGWYLVTVVKGEFETVRRESIFRNQSDQSIDYWEPRKWPSVWESSFFLSLACWHSTLRL